MQPIGCGRIRFFHKLGTIRKISMADRSIATFVIALCFLMPESLHAQVGTPAPGSPPPGAYGPPAFAGQPIHYGPPPGGAPPMMTAGHGPAPGDFGGMPLPAPAYGPAEHFGPGGMWHGGDGIACQTHPGNLDHFYDSPFDNLVKDVAKNSWIRMEYLSWTIKRPGDELLGEPLVLIPNPADPFPIFVGGEEIGTVRVPTLSPFGLQKNDGIRFTFGVPLTFGSFEASIFALRKPVGVKDAPELPSPAFDPIFGVDATLIGTSTLTNGQIGTNVFLYDESFVKTYQSRFWGTEGNLYFDEYAPGWGMNYEPMIGFRYFNLREQLDQVGVFNNFRTEPDLVSTIRSTTNNNLYGPQIGLRAQWIGKFLTFGVEPKFGLGANTYSAMVRTEQLRSPADPTVVTREERSAIAPFAEVGAYIRAHITDYFTLSVGYNFIWLHNVTRPGNNIRYDDFGPLPQPPGVVLDRKMRDITIDGLTIGGEFRFR
jgi:hypothetical protein